jgi:crotonobetainyl-CoA:carnitine CoA-transferase CaiB-like acyl-CoA transferase
MLLANFGAEVIKIEEPGGGDYTRRMPPLIDGEGVVFRATNRGKKSIVPDLKTADRKSTFERLASAPHYSPSVSAGTTGAGSR